MIIHPSTTTTTTPTPTRPRPRPRPTAIITSTTTTAAAGSQESPLRLYPLNRPFRQRFAISHCNVRLCVCVLCVVCCVCSIDKGERALTGSALFKQEFRPRLRAGCGRKRLGSVCSRDRVRCVVNRAFFFFFLYVWRDKGQMTTPKNGSTGGRGR